MNEEEEKYRVCSQLITDGEFEPIRRSKPFVAASNVHDFIDGLNQDYPLFHHWLEIDIDPGGKLITE